MRVKGWKMRESRWGGRESVGGKDEGREDAREEIRRGQEGKGKKWMRGRKSRNSPIIIYGAPGRLGREKIKN